MVSHQPCTVTVLGALSIRRPRSDPGHVRLKEAILNDHNKVGAPGRVQTDGCLGMDRRPAMLTEAVSSVLQLLFVVVMINHYVGSGPRLWLSSSLGQWHGMSFWGGSTTSAIHQGQSPSNTGDSKKPDRPWSRREGRRVVPFSPRPFLAEAVAGSPSARLGEAPSKTTTSRHTLSQHLMWA